MVERFAAGAAEGDESYRAVVFCVTGRVQGVGYRYFALRRAGDLGLVGAVRNLPDGSVEVKAGGSPAELARLQDYLRRGPAAAQVTGVTARTLDPAPRWSRFEITYL
jgi:acylphosphatase